MSNIFIPAGVRDKAMRDTLVAIVRELDKMGGVTTSENDPDQYTPGADGDLIYSESSTSIWVFSSDTNNWILVSGISTAQAAEGYTGTAEFTGTLYYQTIQSAQPNAPTAATWSIANSDFTSITPSNVWSHNQPAANITDTAFREWSTNYTVNLDTSTNPIGVSITFSTPTGAIQVTDDIESDNYAAGSAGWAIRRDDGYAEFGSAAIRGTLTAAQIGAGTITSGKIAAGAVDASKIAANTITANKLSSSSISGLGLTIGTLSDASSGERIVISDNKILVFDSNNNIRVKLGDLS